MRAIIKMLLLIGALLSVRLFAYGDETKHAEEGVCLWDTGKNSETTLSPEAIAARQGWKEVRDEKTALVGDACMGNSYLAIVLRKGAKGAEVYARVGEKMEKTVTISPVGTAGDKAKAIESVTPLYSLPETRYVEARFVSETGKSLALRYLVKKARPFVETVPGDGTETVLVEMRSKHAVIPDLFGADIVVSAQETSETQMRLPSENMLLNMLEGSNAIAQCVWRSGEQDVTIYLHGEGQQRIISGAEIAYKRDLDLHVWVGVLAAPAIWHEKKLSELEAVKFRKLDWCVPFRAQWRADYRRTDGLIDSWKIPFKQEKGDWESFGLSLKKDGTVWHPARGTFGYPAYMEGDAAFLRTPKFEGAKEVKYKPDGVAVIYPFQKSEKSPKEAYAAVDLLKDALVDTPEFTLPEEIQVKTLPRSRYPGVCYTTGEVEKIFDAKEEKKKKQEIVERFTKMNFFNVVVRMRLREYMEWCKRTREFCAREKAAKPQMTSLVDELDGMIARIEKTYADMKLAERTPEAARAITEKFIALIDSDEDKKDEKAKLLGRDSRTIGGTQDRAVGLFRMFTKETRQRAGYRMMEAKDEAAFAFAREIRRRTLEVLQNTIGVEGGVTD